jgi:hypothetical protein
MQGGSDDNPEAKSYAVDLECANRARVSKRVLATTVNALLRMATHFRPIAKILRSAAQCGPVESAKF